MSFLPGVSGEHGGFVPDVPHSKEGDESSGKPSMHKLGADDEDGDETNANESAAGGKRRRSESSSAGGGGKRRKGHK